MPKRKKPTKPTKPTKSKAMSEHTFDIENFVCNWSRFPYPIQLNGYGKWILVKTPDGDFGQFTKVKIQNWDYIGNSNVEELQGLTKKDLTFLENSLQDELNGNYQLCDFLPTLLQP